MKSEAIFSTQKNVSVRGRTCIGSKQTIKQSSIELYQIKTFLDQVEIAGFLPTYYDDIMITQKQYIAKVCNQIFSPLVVNPKLIVEALSIPYENRLEKGHEMKTSKYGD